MIFSCFNLSLDFNIFSETLKFNYILIDNQSLVLLIKYFQFLKLNYVF